MSGRRAVMAAVLLVLPVLAVALGVRLSQTREHGGAVGGTARVASSVDSDEDSTLGREGDLTGGPVAAPTYAPEPTLDVMAITSPEPCFMGKYDGWSASEIADEVVDSYQNLGYIEGEPTIHELVDVYPADAKPLGFSPYFIADACVPDLAVVLEGEIHWQHPLVGVREGPFVMVIVDRRGHVTYVTFADDLETLTQRLPQ